MSSAVPHARKRMGWMYALLAALMVAVAVPAVASANIYDLYPAAPPDPQTTNYPAQGAIGQTLRFTWCVPLKAAPADVSTDGLLKLEGYYPKAEWVVANFTGNGEPFFTGNAGYAKKYINSGQIQSTGDERQMCWFADMGSHKPGLMDLKFFVNMEKIEPWLGDGWDDYSGTLSTPVNHHNFLGIWQEIYDITLVADNSGKPLNVFGEPVNTAGKSGVPLVAKVRGSFPLGDKGKKGGKSTVILPDDFGWLAQQYAVDGAGIGNLFPGTGGAAAHRWDIHDDQVFNNKKKGAVQHPYCQTNFPYTDSTGYNLYKNPPHGTNKGTALRHPFYCNPNTEKRPTPKLLAWWSEGNRFETSLAPFLTYLYNPFTLANAVPWPANDVDSVTNAADFGVTTSNRFSNIYGVLGPANPMGPYDPFRFYETYLADGKTDAGDATAPAWRIDFNILANGSAKGSKKGVNAIDGAGYLAEVDKNNRYTVDKNGNWQVGFETEELTSPFYSRYVPALGPYQLGVGTTRAKYSSNVAGYLAPGEYHLWDFVGQWAIDQNRGGGVTGCAESFDDATRVLRKKPAGTDLAATHADEHGEAQVQLKPGTGFYFDALGVKPNSQYGCDLQGIDVLGTSTVVATAYYPDQQPIGYKQMSSNPITKTWNNGYNKQISYAPKGGNNPGWRVVVWETDITGNASVLEDDEDGKEYDIACLSAPNGGHVTMAQLVDTSASGNPPNVSPQDDTEPEGIETGPSLMCIEMQVQPGAKVASAHFDVTGVAPLDLFVNFTDTHVKRKLTIPAKKSSGGNPPPVDGNGKAVKPDTFPKVTKAVPTDAQLKGAGLLTKTRVAVVKRVKYKKFRANGKVKRGKVFIKVKSPTTKAKVKIQLMGINKKGAWVALKTYKRVVKANTKKFVTAKVIKPARLANRVQRVEATVLRTMGRPIA